MFLSKTPKISEPFADLFVYSQGELYAYEKFSPFAKA